MKNCKKKSEAIKLKRKLIKEEEKKRLEKINDEKLELIYILMWLWLSDNINLDF